MTNPPVSKLIGSLNKQLCYFFFLLIMRAMNATRTTAPATIKPIMMGNPEELPIIEEPPCSKIFFPMT